MERRPPAKSRKRWPDLSCTVPESCEDAEAQPFGFAGSHLGGQFEDAGYGMTGWQAEPFGYLGGA